MGWLSKATHGIAHGIGKGAGYVAKGVTGNKSVQKEVEKAATKAVKYVPPVTPSALAYQSAHIAGHVQDKVHNALNPSIPEQETPSIEMPDYSEYLNQIGEYLAGMQDYIRDATALMTREEPAQEPLKRAQVEMSDARADTQRRQLLRRGLMSTYTRYGQSGGTQRLGA